MSRRSIKKPLYNNALEYLSVEPTNKKDQQQTNHVCKIVAVSLYPRVLFQTAALLLVVSFFTQPVFAHAQEPELAAENVVEEEAAETTEQPAIAEPEQTVEPNTVEPALPQTETQQPREEEFEVISTTTESDPEETEAKLNLSIPEEAVEASTSPASSEEVLADEQSESQTQSQNLPTATSSELGDSEPDLTTDESATSSDLNASTSTATSTTSGADETDQDESVSSTSSSSTTNQSSSGDSSQGQTDPETDSATTTSSGTTTATTTPVATVVSTVQSNGEFSFNRDECTVVEDGSYYCQKTQTKPVQQDDLFAALDADGDLEIFVRQAGEERQITNNLVDDASPYFDPRSNTIVWHRLVNDRYQIVSYDIAVGEEEIVTNTRVNNMEPSRSGSMTVWQRWVDDNWEIILLQDGTPEIQLTDSIEHDLAPNIRGDLVIWNVRASDGTHSLMTYDVSSGLFNTISDPDGVAVSNPRMVVVYDAVYENGDTVMKGFDLVTGELIPLDQTPAELPAELPTPDSTGETRALVAPAPAKPEQEEPESDPTEPGPTPEEPDTLDLASNSTATTTDQTPVEFDLDLRDKAESSTTSLDNAADLVVPPVGTTSTSTQSL